MKRSLFDYKLPAKRIANEPAKPRDSAKLLVYNRTTNQVLHDTFLHLDKYLKAGDVLIFNNTKVFPARLLGFKESGGKAEILLLKDLSAGNWEVLIGARNPKPGLKMLFAGNLIATVLKPTDGKSWIVNFNLQGKQFDQLLLKIGEMPLPPYIHSTAKQSELQEQYQTIYAKHQGSAAAPTAGLHFTRRLMSKLARHGVQMEYVTLHVGLGTFEPVNTENIENYHIHKEWIKMDKATQNRLLKAKNEGRRLIAVGTTSVRVLESLWQEEKAKKDLIKETEIFIYPGYKFKAIDGMITNFHLPKSSLIMLVCAFVGREKTLKLYQLAIKLKYKFFSFGDGMFLS